jgi:hypothetical protein
MPCEFAYGLTKLAFDSSVIALLNGGQFSTAGSLTLTLHGQNRAGFTIASNEVTVNYTASQAIQITLPISNKTDATDFHWYWLCHDGMILCGWKTYEYATDENRRVIGISDRVLTPIVLNRAAHITLAPAVDTATQLPIGADLLQGMVRLISSKGAFYYYDPGEYRAVDGTQVITPPSRPTEKWVRMAGNPLLSAVTDPYGDSGCAQDVTTVPLDAVLAPPKYPMDGSRSFPLKLYWRNNSSMAVSAGTTFGIEVRQEGVIRSQVYDRLLIVRPRGMVNLANGALVTVDSNGTTINELGGTRTWEYGVRGLLTLRTDLPTGWAYFVEVYLQFSSEQVQREILEGTRLSIILFPFAQAGNFAGDLWELVGGKSLVFFNGDLLRVLPNDGGGVDVLEGSALVERFSFPAKARHRVYGIAPNRTGQKVTIDGNGGIFLRGGSVPSTEAIRAIVDCAVGYSQAGEWKSVAITVNQAISITCTYPNAIRNDYPVIGGNTKGSFNLPVLAVFVRFGGRIYEVRVPAIANPQIGTLSGLTEITTLPAPPSSDHGLFSPPTITLQGASGGSLIAGTYEIAIAYYLDGTQVSRISHNPAEGCMVEVPGSFVDLFSHLIDTNNPHQVTPAQLDVPTIGDAIGLILALSD